MAPADLLDAMYAEAWELLEAVGSAEETSDATIPADPVTAAP